jgi:hypothetical protein
MNRDDFKMIPNPYIVGNPVEDSRMFFGRLDDFEYIRKKVTGETKGGVLVLCGSRRSGKTSILFQIRNGRLGEEYVPVLIDMQSVTVRDDTEFLENLATEISNVLGDPEALAGADFKRHLGENPLAAFQEFIKRVDEKLAGKKLVLMFDEYELFEAHIDRERFSTDVLNLLSNWMEHQAGVFILFTGSDKLEERNAVYWDHFLGKALHRRVSFLSRPDAMRLITEPIKEYVTFDDGVPNEVFRLTSGQPFYTQVICQSLVDHLNESGTNHATSDTVHRVVEEIIENPLPQMIFAWSSLSALERMSLSIIAEISKEKEGPITPDEIISYATEEKIGYELEPNKLRETLERLFIQDYLDKDEAEGYTFKMDLWRRWMIRMHSIWQVIDEIISEEGELEEGIIIVRRRRARILAFTLAAAAVVAIGIPLIYSAFIKKAEVPEGYVAPVDSTLLTVETEPPGATVFLDNLVIGDAPVSGAKVAARRSLIVVSFPGYHDYSDSLDLVKDTPMELSVVMDEIVGDISITSSPSHAGITLDGEATGLTTPVTIPDLSTNTLHSIKFSLAGYNSRTYSGIEVFDDSTVVLHHNFSRVTHPLTITSEPNGAQVHLDGNYFGNTPRSLASVAEGSHELEIRMEGYYPTKQNISIPAPDDEIAVTLTKLPPGILILEIRPYAELYINGELIEQDAVNYRAELDQGTYTIELRHPHFDNITDTVVLKSQETVTKRYRMDQKEQE